MVLRLYIVVKKRRRRHTIIVKRRLARQYNQTLQRVIELEVMDDVASDLECRYDDLCSCYKIWDRGPQPVAIASGSTISE